MKADVECAACILKWVFERASNSAGEKERFELLSRLLHVLSEEFTASANVGFLCNRCTGAVHEFVEASAKHYNALKLKSNDAAKALLDRATDYIERGSSPADRFKRACGLASAGNVAPIGAPSGAFEFDEVENLIMGRDPLPLVLGDVYQAAQSASHVLYVADNAGEIGFDALLIGLLKDMGLRVTLLVKEEPFFDDATEKDAAFFGLQDAVDDMRAVKGVFVPGYGSEGALAAFGESDLIMTKGTGNYEALKDEVAGKPSIYMLKIKCGPIARAMDTSTGGFVVKLEV
jgi:hypothetical protein